MKENGIITKDNFEVKFIGILHAKIIKLIKELNLDDVIFTSGVLDRENYIKSISKADLLLAFNYQMKNLIPGKLYDYWGARNPILLIDSLDSMASKLVAENNLGTVNDFEDVEGMYNSIKSYFDAWYNNNPIPKSDIANLYNYDRKKLTGKLVEIFKSLEC